MNFTDRAAWYDLRAKVLEASASANGGMLPRSAHWELDYLRYPCLIQASDEAVRQRYIDIFENTVSLNEEGLVTPNLAMQGNFFIISRFGHIMIEAQSRYGGMPVELMVEGNAFLEKYFKVRPPRGVQLFRAVRRRVSGSVLVKYAEQRSFVEDMLRFGRFRISPASFYSSGSLLHAQQDLETSRIWVLPAYPYRKHRKASENYFGRYYPTLNGDIEVKRDVVDYYLLSMCANIDTRLATDFRAAAALVIHRPETFMGRVEAALQKRFPDFQVLRGEVEYYDPYDLPQPGPICMKKHFRFTYQREYRFVAIRRASVFLNPVFIEIGPLDEVAEAVYDPP